jgi:hypothetical protein
MRRQYQEAFVVGVVMLSCYAMCLAEDTSKGLSSREVRSAKQYVGFSVDLSIGYI